MPTMIGRMRFLGVTMTNLIERLRNSQNRDDDNPATRINLSPRDVEILKRYLVLDLPDSNASDADISCVKVVLIVESPHVDEVCHKHPLAGPSGKNVTTKYLTTMIESKKPIGCLVVSGQIPWLSLINVSQLPLQKNDYCEARQDYSHELKQVLQTLGEIKCKFDKLPKNKTSPRLTGLSSHIYDIIISDLACRIEKARRRCRTNPMFVPCGKIARISLNRVHASLRRIGVEICIYQGNVPHPAYYWTQNNYQSNLDALKSSIRLRVQGTTNE